MSQVFITETGFRDGIQALSEVIPTALKVECIKDLVDAGLKRLEVASFVHPKRVPTMADAEKVCQQLDKRDDVTYIGLVLNERGLDRALNTQLDTIQSIVYGTETFAKKNAGYSFEESKQSFKNIAQKANNNHVGVIGCVTVAFGCRYEGKVAENTVLDLVKFLLDQNITMLNLADSTGMANPQQVKELCYKTKDLAGDIPVSLHLHNTENKGYANLFAALESGVRYFDTAFGGLGGCPFIPKAKGNIATEDTIHMLRQMDYQTEVNINKIAEVSHKISDFLQRELAGMMYKLVGNSDIKII